VSPSFRPRHRAAAIGLALGVPLALSLLTSPAAAASVATLTVGPWHGVLSASFTASYTISPCQPFSGREVRFFWDAVPPGGQLLGSALLDGSCKAELTETPPSQSHKGNHVVFAFAASPEPGMTETETLAAATYLVDPYTDFLASGPPAFGPPPYFMVASTAVSRWLFVLALLVLAAVLFGFRQLRRIRAVRK
jgi:hypothetical protein